MIERWSRDQVLALAPDASSQKAAQGVAAPGKWSLRGAMDTVLYGECKGSGAKPYLACVDLTEPAYRCSCPSRKFPCKHALGLLLMWSADEVPASETAPQWVTEWMEGRAERAAKSAARIEAARARATTEAAAETPDQTAEVPDSPATSGTPTSDGPTSGGTGSGGVAPGGTASGGTAGAGARSQVGTPGEAASGGDTWTGAASDEGMPDGAVPSRTGSGGVAPAGTGSGGAVSGGAGSSKAAVSAGAGAESVRHGRVASGLAEVERWLADQVRQGLAGAAEHDWDGLAKRLIDAQAPGVAGIVSRLSRVRAEDDWPGRLLEEYALINLLAVAYRRRAELPRPLAQTVLIRAGFPIPREEVLAGVAIRDHWDVLGRRDEEQDRLTARRVWLRGRRTGRAALILSFAPQGQPLDASLVTGTTIDADLTYYPGAAPLRALVATRHGIVSSTGPRTGPLTGHGVAGSAGRETVPPTGGGTASLTGHGAAASVGRGTASFAGGSSTPSAAAGAGVLKVPPGVSAEEALDEVARVLAEDPWTEAWPLVLAGVVPERDSIGGLPLHPRARDPWRLIAVSGGRPLTVAVEWSPQGLRPLTTWDDEGTAVIL
ncbi:SWIM zinc finger family protein [Nonomuraea solani]|uniref:SWIM zinc finger family protein n=1 Tax=Nonomuraea solani TaxID=1144553 RepID=UPI002E132723